MHNTQENYEKLLKIIKRGLAERTRITALITIDIIGSEGRIFLDVEDIGLMMSVDKNGLYVDEFYKAE